MDEELMAQRKTSKKLKGKVLLSCVIPTNLYGLETGHTDRETTTEVVGMQEQLGQEDCENKEGGSEDG